MDKTTKLIRWQRLTIATLLFSVIAVGVQDRMNARSAAWWEAEANHRSSLIWDKCEESDTKEQVIHDLDTRLKQYEAKYGEIQPVRQGEGVYIANQNFTCRLPLKR